MNTVHAMLNYSHFGLQRFKEKSIFSPFSSFRVFFAKNSFYAENVFKIYNYCFLFQIRAEKPYYMADPEVDSLVSWKI